MLKEAHGAVPADQSCPWRWPVDIDTEVLKAEREEGFADRDEALFPEPPWCEVHRHSHFIVDHHDRPIETCTYWRGPPAFCMDVVDRGKMVPGQFGGLPAP